MAHPLGALWTQARVGVRCARQATRTPVRPARAISGARSATKRPRWSPHWNADSVRFSNAPARAMPPRPARGARLGHYRGQLLQRVWLAQQVKAVARIPGKQLAVAAGEDDGSSGRRSRMVRARSRPFMPGITTSLNTTWKREASVPAPPRPRLHCAQASRCNRARAGRQPQIRPRRRCLPPRARRRRGHAAAPIAPPAVPSFLLPAPAQVQRKAATGARLALHVHLAFGLLDETEHLAETEPVPAPTLLVVKKGSKMRSTTAGSMPAPVSVTLMAAKSPFIGRRSAPKAPQ